MGLSELTEFAEEHGEHRDKAINLIQPLLQDPDEIIRMIAADSLKNLEGKVEFTQQVEEFKKQYEEKVAKIRKVRINQKDLNEIRTKIQSYEGKLRFSKLSFYVCLFLATALIWVPRGLIPAVVMLGVFFLVFVYYKYLIARIKRLIELLERKSK